MFTGVLHLVVFLEQRTSEVLDILLLGQDSPFEFLSNYFYLFYLFSIF